jgi:peptidoglycan/LPS O-acetylase OafA/YrhL
LQNIFSIGVLRALAALAVMSGHAQEDLVRRLGLAQALPDMKLGYAGVDVFFVISGFIMVHASDRLFGTADGPLNFLRRRLIRIVPLYWSVTTLYLAIALGAPHLPHKAYSPSMVAASYLFFPLLTSDGLQEPVVGQGWTLNCEMLFYMLFCIAVTRPRYQAVLLVSSVLAIAVMAGNIFALPMPLAYWSQEIVLEFVFGMALGLIYMSGVRLRRWSRMLLIGTGLLLLGRTAWEIGAEDPHRSVVWGIPAALIVAGAVLGASSGPWTGVRWMGVIGDASYALYLIHPLVGRAIREVFIRSGADLVAVSWLYFAAVAAATIAAALAVHFWFERPITRALRDRFEGRERLMVPAAERTSSAPASSQGTKPLAR